MAGKDKESSIPRLNKSYTAHLIGHAHIDMNWLWVWEETIKVCQDTFSSMVKLMKEFPQLCFSQSQPTTYLAVEETKPKLFAQIKKLVKEGRWEITGATWVEGDMNIASGEAIVRQLLYAQRYFKEKFGVQTKVCWEPDTFGHAWTIPQILKKSGIEYYYFCRCGKEPVFWWEAPDGSRVLAFWGGYKGFYSRKVDDSLSSFCLDFEKRYGIKDYMLVYGVGDHGGGPRREDIKTALKFKKKAFYPKIKFNTAGNYYQKILSQTKKIPVIKDELNSTFEGCYTTHARTKKENRLSENLLTTAEVFSSLAKIYGLKYPQNDFVSAWRSTCFNQFHDILDGSNIHSSFEHSTKLFKKQSEIGKKALNNSLNTIASKINLQREGIAVVVFNPLSWERDDVVKLETQGTRDKGQGARGKRQGAKFKILNSFLRDSQGRDIPYQITDGEITFIAKGVPALGYKSYYLGEDRSQKSEDGSKMSDTLENKFYRIKVGLASGCILSIYDKINKREVISPGKKANLFQLLFEKPHDMSAWNIGPISKIKNLSSKAEIKLREKGEVYSLLQIKHKFNKSTFTQDIVLYNDLPRIDFPTTVDWQEQGTKDKDGPMLKVSFPVNVGEGKARFEIPFGSIERKANGGEAPALKWIDLSNKDYGVSLLNDCKYGHDVGDNVMRLTLLRSSYDPDPCPDRGIHKFTYSLYPHQGDYKRADTVRRGYEINNPLIAVVNRSHSGDLADTHSFVELRPHNLIMTALKKCEDSSDLILRFYESQGRRVTATIKLGMKVKGAREVDLLERDIKRSRDDPSGRLYRRSDPGETLNLPVGKYEIKAIRLLL